MNPVKDRNIKKAIIFSLLVHLAAISLIIFVSSNNLISPVHMKGMNLVWVSLDAKNEKSGGPVKNIPAQELLPTPEQAPEKTIAGNYSSRETRTTPQTTTSAMNLTGDIVQAKYMASGTGSQGQLMNIKGSGTERNSDDLSVMNTVIAFPLYKENAPPVYPEIARVRGYEGIVLVSAEILPSGRVGEVKIRKSSGYAILDQSAIQAVKPWKFEPAKKSGNPFTAWVELPIKFILHKNSQS